MFDIEEDLEEEEEAKVRKEEEDRMRQKMNALRKKMDSIAVDKVRNFVFVVLCKISDYRYISLSYWEIPSSSFEFAGCWPISTSIL